MLEFRSMQRTGEASSCDTCVISHQAWEAFGQLRDSTQPGKRERRRRQPTKGRCINIFFLSPRNRNFLSLLTHFFLLPDGQSPACDPWVGRHVPLVSHTQVLHSVFKVLQLSSSKHDRLHNKVWIPLIEWKVQQYLVLCFSQQQPAGTSKSCVHWLGLSSSLQLPTPHIHFSPSRHQCVSQKASCSVCIMPENREGHSTPTRLEITTLQETELIHLMCISDNLFKSGSSFLDHFPHRE